MSRAIAPVPMLVLVLAAAAHAHAAALQAPCQPSAEDSRARVLAFYRQALVDRQPRAAFETYASPDFVEHKPDIPVGDRASVAAFLEGLVAEMPEARWEIVRSVAEPEWVFVHARFTPAAGAEPWALADLFRVRDCAIVEHWDVVGPPREGMPNPHSRF